MLVLSFVFINLDSVYFKQFIFILIKLGNYIDITFRELMFFTLKVVFLYFVEIVVSFDYAV